MSVRHDGALGLLLDAGGERAERNDARVILVAQRQVQHQILLARDPEPRELVGERRPRLRARSVLGPRHGQRVAPRTRGIAARLGPANAMDTNALHGRKRPAQGAKAKAGRAPGEPLQRSDGRFRQQPEGNGCLGAPLFVALLAKTSRLGFRIWQLSCRDWRPTPPVRVCTHSVNRPYSPSTRTASTSMRAPRGSPATW